MLVHAIRVAVWTATFAVMLGGALRVGPVAFLQLRDRPGLFVRTLIAIWFAVPIVNIVVVFGLRVTGLGATTLLLMSVCPGVPLLLASARSVRGAVSTAFLALLLSAAIEPLMLPLWTHVMSAIQPANLTIQPLDVMRVRIPTLWLPIAVGFALRALWPRATGVLAYLSDGVYIVGFVASAIVVLIEGFPMLFQVPPRTFVAAVVITIGDGLIGYWAGWPRREDQKAIAVAAALTNPALALAVVEVSYPGYQAGALVAVYLLLRGAVMLPFEFWLRRATGRPVMAAATGSRAG
jgi:predicted Na+-dependent transporter